MQRLSGLLLILAGVSLGAYTFLPAPFDSQQSLREITRISAAPDRQGRTRWLQSDDDAIETGSVSPATRETIVEKRAAAKAVTAPASDRPAQTWSAIVMADGSQQARINSPKPDDSETRRQLTRDLQTELKRVGCYGGPISGSWTQSTRRAMSAFMEQVNASLPIDEPDYILLTLVQGHSAIACGVECAAGQVSIGGRCVASAVTASRVTKKPRDVDVANASEHPRDDLPALTARAAAPAPAKPVAVAAVDQGAIEQIAGSAGREAGSTRSESLPWLTDELADLPPPVPAPRRAVRRPEGMMAVGAPQAMASADLDAATPAAPIAPPAHRFKAPASAFAPLPARTYPGEPRFKSAIAPYAPAPVFKKKHAATRRAPAPAPVAAKPGKKSKFLYFAGSGRRGLAQPNSPAFRMLQAMRGVY